MNDVQGRKSCSRSAAWPRIVDTMLIRAGCYSIKAACGRCQSKTDNWETAWIYQIQVNWVEKVREGGENERLETVTIRVTLRGLR